MKLIRIAPENLIELALSPQRQAAYVPLSAQPFVWRSLGVTVVVLRSRTIRACLVNDHRGLW